MAGEDSDAKEKPVDALEGGGTGNLIVDRILARMPGSEVVRTRQLPPAKSRDQRSTESLPVSHAADRRRDKDEAASSREETRPPGQERTEVAHATGELTLILDAVLAQVSAQLLTDPPAGLEKQQAVAVAQWLRERSRDALARYLT